VQVFEELLRVPLVIRLPGGRFAGARVGQVAQLTDVMPTLLAELGIASEVPAQGVNLLPAMAGEIAAPRSAFGRNQAGTQYALRTGRFKLVESRVPPASYLFDLEADPLETSSVAGRHRERAEAMRARLAEWRSAARAQRPPARPPTELKAEVKDALRALGYAEE